MILCVIYTTILLFTSVTLLLKLDCKCRLLGGYMLYSTQWISGALFQNSLMDAWYIPWKDNRRYIEILCLKDIYTYIGLFINSVNYNVGGVSLGMALSNPKAFIVPGLLCAAYSGRDIDSQGNVFTCGNCWLLRANGVLVAEGSELLQQDMCHGIKPVTKQAFLDQSHVHNNTLYDMLHFALKLYTS